MNRNLTFAGFSRWNMRCPGMFTVYVLAMELIKLKYYRG
jgi:hypothetical protein